MIAYIYAIKNVINNKMYVGSTKYLKKRQNEHFNYLKKGNHHSCHLQQSYNKYGKDKFFFYLLEECSIDNRKERELYYITFYKSFNEKYGYNIYEPNEDRFKCSENTKNNIRLTHSKHKYSIPINVYNYITHDFIKSYNSMKECAKELNISVAGIQNVVKKKGISFKGLVFTKLDEEPNFRISTKQRNMSKYY